MKKKKRFTKVQNKNKHVKCIHYNKTNKTDFI